ncbi:uncharacterized protein TRAVEDRAFT_46485 [Trametes versicolor FP-101664 SS1]|uniref:uncharacterized protein n=1 Tax=Trametes versicolor (strain FP-101664) TaxID=717944 RepID=UPI0004621C57|nr:uncharacterized protein TRAVEDRAFT_46485 [Trametes versicolor FP-101664 SS1]EIW59178.1 hypothetical protein TRAVEDRAFT_46485 [Trametes versicolor FP-101664 SS1]
MPSVRSPLRCKKPTVKSITGVMYACDGRQPALVHVPTAIHSTRDGLDNPSFPSFEAILGADGELHETWITCLDAVGREHRFLIAAHYCSDCEVNASLKLVLPEVDWRGGLVVMRGGCRSFVVNMGGTVFKKLAHAAVQKYLFETAHLVAASVQQNIPLVIPVDL